MNIVNCSLNCTLSSPQTDLELFQFPNYLKFSFLCICSIIMLIGSLGNIMVPIVIMQSKDMRNSTNYFLINLSIADLLVLLLCTPTIFIEINTKPEVWVLGQEMCKLVPFIELTVAHTSVLTILAISFERFYAICKPFKAGYICTKRRAGYICVSTWLFAATVTSPMLCITEYQKFEFKDNSLSSCLTLVDSSWKVIYFILITLTFFVLPVLILLVIYAKITCNLMIHTPNLLLSTNSTAQVITQTNANTTIWARKKVILMLGIVIMSFFACQFPFRAFTLWVIISSLTHIEGINDGLDLNPEVYYNIVYFCRIMIYLNSAMNPILYNLMSSKFRDGFRKCLCKRDHSIAERNVCHKMPKKKVLIDDDIDEVHNKSSVSYKSSSTNTTNTSSSNSANFKVCLKTKADGLINEKKS